MRLGVRGVHELAGDEAVRDLLGQLVRLCDRALHALRALGKHQLRTVGLHQLAALDGHGLWHDDNNAVSARGSDGGKADARVAGGRLNDDRALLQKTLLLCVVDHRLGDAVFDRARGVEVFKLGEDGGLETIGLFQMCELQQRGVANELIGGSIDVRHIKNLLFRQIFKIQIVFSGIIVSGQRRHRACWAAGERSFAISIPAFHYLYHLLGRLV